MSMEGFQFDFKSLEDCFHDFTPTFTCSICKNVIRFDFLHSTSCDHEFCRECLSRYCKDKIKNTNVLTIGCPNCNVEITEEEMTDLFVPRDLILRLQERRGLDLARKMSFGTPEKNPNVREGFSNSEGIQRNHRKKKVVIIIDDDDEEDESDDEIQIILPPPKILSLNNSKPSSLELARILQKEEEEILRKEQERKGREEEESFRYIQQLQAQENENSGIKTNDFLIAKDLQNEIKKREAIEGKDFLFAQKLAKEEKEEEEKQRKEKKKSSRKRKLSEVKGIEEDPRFKKKQKISHLLLRKQRLQKDRKRRQVIINRNNNFNNNQIYQGPVNNFNNNQIYQGPVNSFNDLMNEELRYLVAGIQQISGEYPKAMLYIQKMVNNLSSKGVRVENIMKKNLTIRFLNYYKKLKSEYPPTKLNFGYHGTIAKHYPGILRDGMKVEKVTRSVYGKGTYLSPSAKVAITFIRGGFKKLLVIGCIQGRIFKAPSKVYQGKGLKNGYHSHISLNEEYAMVLFQNDSMLPCFTIHLETNKKNIIGDKKNSFKGDSEKL